MTAADCREENDQKPPLEIALGIDQPIPWPQSVAEEVELENRRLAADLPPTARRSEKEIARVLALLDELETEGRSR